jgi:arsenite methyltransferase
VAELQADLLRAGSQPWAWVINNSLPGADITSGLLRQRAGHELDQIGQVRGRHAARVALVPVQGEQPVGINALRHLGHEEEIFGAALYRPGETDGLPEEAVLASLGCGNPLAVADLRPGERVLDLGSGGGIDVLLSARRVGPSGFAYGLDMTDEMLQLARSNAAKAGAENVEFMKGQIEDIPLPDSSIDVVISNCVINLSTDKPAVLAEMFRVLTPGGRLGISDVVAEDGLSVAERAERGSYVGCIAGALSRSEYLDGMTAAGFVDPEVVFTHEAAPGMHGAIVRATKPVMSPRECPTDPSPAGAVGGFAPVVGDERLSEGEGGVRRSREGDSVRFVLLGLGVRARLPGRGRT